MRLFILLLAAGLAAAQTTRYPGAVDDDSSLFVVKDNVQTSLSAPMGISDTVAVVASATGFVPNMIVTICDTSTNTGKCTAWEHMLVTSISGNVLTVTRAFGGTSARTHSSGRLLSAFIDASHQKVLKDAVVAMQISLGPNLQNIARSPVTNVSAYKFSPYVCSSSSACSPGGSSGLALIAGTNALTMNPVPLGVNGSDVGHYLYVSGGTGTPEGCLITGGSGTSSQASGQIIINCANTHSGAWTVASGSGGIQEAIVSLGPTTGSWDGVGTGGGQVFAGCDTYDIWGGPVLVPSNVEFAGNPDCTVLRSQGVTPLATKAKSFRVSIHDMTINMGARNNIQGLDVNSTSSSEFKNLKIVGGTPSTGSKGIWVRASNIGLEYNSTYNLFDHILIEIGPSQGLVLEGQPNGEITGGVVTLSTFRSFRVAPSGAIAVNLIQACDSNFFYDFIISSTVPNSIGFFLNSGSPTVENGASGIKIENLICEGSAPTSQCVAIFASSENLINGLRSYWETPYFFSPNAKTTTITNILSGIPPVMQPMVRTMGEPVASGITVTLADSVFHLTGTAAISGITAGPLIKGPWGCITMIPDGAWTLVTGGNIAAASTAIVGKPMQLCYDGVAQKWHPSY